MQRTSGNGPRQLATAAVTAELRRQRRAQADAILRGIARSYAGRPAADVRRVLAIALRGVRVRPAPATLSRLAAAISAGRPAVLPGS